MILVSKGVYYINVTNAQCFGDKLCSRPSPCPLLGGILWLGPCRQQPRPEVAAPHSGAVVAVKKVAGSLGADVKFLGQLDQSEVIEVLKMSNRFVLNSEYEGLPHVLLEARASGVLCLAKEGTGSSEVITHLRDGILFGPSIGLTLTQALKYSYSTSINKNEMVAAGLLDVRSRFNQEINFGQIQDILYAE